MIFLLLLTLLEFGVRELVSTGFFEIDENMEILGHWLLVRLDTVVNVLIKKWIGVEKHFDTSLE